MWIAAVFRAILVAGLVWLSGARTATASVIVGEPGDPLTGNCIPFGCTRDGPTTRYQQVYASGEFGGPILIIRIDFFMTQLPGGSLNSGLYNLFLSTTPRAVNALDPNFNSNVGPNQQPFASQLLTGGAAPPVLSFTGVPFLYDPLGGNLLLDIQLLGVTHVGNDAFHDARNGTASGALSRMHDFALTDGAFENRGLVTGFVSAPEPGAFGLSFLGLSAALAMASLRSRRSG